MKLVLVLLEGVSELYELLFYLKLWPSELCLVHKLFIELGIDVRLHLSHDYIGGESAVGVYDHLVLLETVAAVFKFYQALHWCVHWAHCLGQHIPSLLLYSDCNCLRWLYLSPRYFARGRRLFDDFLLETGLQVNSNLHFLFLLVVLLQVEMQS